MHTETIINQFTDDFNKYSKQRDYILKVSLIISTYNSALKLKKVLEHIKGGSILPDEIIISDDGSNNETVKIVMEWQSEMPIKHIWHEDKGFRKCKILNKSLNSINYNYAIFLDGDCIPHKSFVADHKYLAQKGFFIQGRRCFVQEKEVSKLINNKGFTMQPRPFLIKNKWAADKNQN